ncbi:MAG: four-carbon acid sugar kinase family protein [Bacteroidota bacterium]|nr:four-carbon acid sugar kinase family protein [Bacteroidota bacterium]
MITVIADDLTGAAEIAGVCLRYGLKVAFGLDSVPEEPADVVVIATDSRSGTIDGAYRIHRLMATKASTSDDTLIFKKVDSVLRGYIVQEIKAVMSVTGKSKVLLQPANPAAGRCIRDGKYFVGDTLLEDTGFSADPDFPAGTSEVAELLNERALVGDKANQFPIITGDVREFQEKAIYLPDCSSENELGFPLANWEPDTLLVGSAAFFEQVLLKITGAKKAMATKSIDISSSFLIVCGTAHPQGQRFLERLKTEAGCPIRYFPSQFLQEKISEGEFSRWAKSLIPDWKWSNKMAISVSQSKVSFPGSSSLLRLRMDEVVAELVKNCPVQELLIEGGATAYSVLNYLKWKTLIPEQELEPGVVRMRVGRRPSLYLTIKPGSYSWPSGIAGIKN